MSVTPNCFRASIFALKLILEGEMKCPFCNNLSVDTTPSIHKPEDDPDHDILPFTNIQDGAHHFYCNNYHCRAFLGATWRKKHNSEMSKDYSSKLVNNKDLDDKVYQKLAIQFEVWKKQKTVAEANRLLDEEIRDNI